MSTGEANYDRINDYGAVRISLASSHDIRSWSFGEVKKPETIIYFQDYVVVNPGETPLKERQLLTEDNYRKARESYGDTFEAGMGAEAVKKLLEHLDLVDLSRELRQKLHEENDKEKEGKK